ncbi:MAG: glycerol-3-phosphate dehydrogenase subunit GlpB [Desulfobacteraceae bacterium]
MNKRVKTSSDSFSLAVIGAGTAGIAASVFAAQRGISTVQLGKPSEIAFASGCLDLFSTLPGEPPRSFSSPREGIRAMAASNPAHPYARVSESKILDGFDSFTRFMASCGIRYHIDPDRNRCIITPAGTLKSTLAVPSAMAAGADAVEKKQRILIIGIHGLKGFGAKQAALPLQRVLPEIETATVEFPGRENTGDLLCERLAWDLEKPSVLEAFAGRIKPFSYHVDAVGVPAVLGIWRFEELRRQLETFLGRPVFEIPAFAPSVTGLRMKEAFISRAADAGITVIPETVEKIHMDTHGGFVFTVVQGLKKREIRAEYLIMATGRFMGRGLGVRDGAIREMLFDIPVNQPPDRSGWYHRDFFHPAGHPVNRAGIETDSCFRPLGKGGAVFHSRLYAAGGILAHQDWKREKSGSGISIASAFKAVSSIAADTGAGKCK